MLRWLEQVFVVAELNLRTLPQRWIASLVAMIGVAGVVGVFVAVLSIGEGFKATMASTGAPDTVIVTRSGSNAEMMSVLSRDEARVIQDAPGILRGSTRVSSAEVFMIADFPKRTTGTDANVPIRGVSPGGFLVRKDLRIVEGRQFGFGRNELIVGEAAVREFSGLDLSTSVKLGEDQWTVVGVFSTGGTAADSEIWGDGELLAASFRRSGAFQSVYARLESPESFDRFKDWLTTNPALNVDVKREAEYYEEQSRVLRGIVTGLGGLVAGLMGIGAVFGALNTMYSAVSARSREIATLRALGFGGAPVALSVLVESLLLALVGGALGGVLAYVGFNGFTTSTINWQTFSQVAFAFAVTPKLLVQGVLYSLAMGLVGGLFPAWRAARLPVAAALREL